MQAAGGDSEKREQEKVYLSAEAMRSNHRALDLARTVMSICGGVCTGIMGYTNLSGLLSFLAFHALLALALAAAMGFDTALYTAKSPGRFLFDGITANGGAFVLFWTLAYALVYIY